LALTRGAAEAAAFEHSDVFADVKIVEAVVFRSPLVGINLHFGGRFRERGRIVARLKFFSFFQQANAEACAGKAHGCDAAAIAAAYDDSVVSRFELVDGAGELSHSLSLRM